MSGATAMTTTTSAQERSTHRLAQRHYARRIRAFERLQAHGRSVSSKHPMHLVLRSTAAKGEFGFRHPKNLKKVRRIVDSHCRRYGVKLIEFSNNFNHLHFLIKFPSRA